MPHDARRYDTFILRLKIRRYFQDLKQGQGLREKGHDPVRLDFDMAYAKERESGGDTRVKTKRKNPKYNKKDP
jgi:hypothetical protein